MRIRIVGIGTPWGDDAAGLAVVQELAARHDLPAGVEAVACRRPVELVDLLEGVDGVVLVDATRSDRPPGSVHEPAPEALREARTLTSHALGVCEALALARALERVPERLAVVGIEAEATGGGALSPPVRAAVPEAASRARALCDAWRTAAGARGRETARA